MKASEAQLLQFLRGPKQFIIPIYQRSYSWTLKECQQLWSDILRVARDETLSSHFIGSVVYVERGLYQVSSVPQLLVIDGQQRLTTLSLLVTALGRAAKASGNETEVSHRRLNNYYLFNPEEDGLLRYKLLLTESDRDTLLRIIDEQAPPEQPSRRIVDNLQFFEDQIQASGIDLSQLYAALQKLIIVDIALNRDHDNPQLIFESLNSTGLDLSQADLIRNYVLMGLSPNQQELLYMTHWRPMEQRFGHSDYVALFDRFMRDYLTLKTRQIPNVREIYQAFKAYAASSASGSIEEIVADIHRFSQYFVNMALERDPDPSIRAVFKNINELTVYVAYPFFLELYADYDAGVISRDELVAIVHVVESYIIRRAICGIPTNSLNRTFQTLGREIDRHHYVESSKAAFQLMESYRRFPTDEEFKREFAQRDIYTLTNRRNYILRKLENFDSREVVRVEACTIEHIMPQNENLSPAWRNDLGPEWKRIQDTYLHTVGNLTLTLYNPELSDRPFQQKRDMKGGFRDSNFRLSRDLVDLDSWTEPEIIDRSERLAALALRVWPAPSLSDEAIDRYRNKPKAGAGAVAEYTLDNHPHLTGPMLDLFELLRSRLLDLDPSVTEDILKLYIAYKTTTNFVDVVPQKNRLRLSLNLEFSEIDDPRGWCKDVSNVGRWGNGDVEVGLSSPGQLDYIMFLVHQSFVRHADVVTG